MVKNYPDVTWYNLYYIDCGFFSEQDKERLKKFEESYPCTIHIASPEDLAQGSFDFSVCLGCTLGRSPLRFTMRGMNS